MYYSSYMSATNDSNLNILLNIPERKKFFDANRSNLIFHLCDLDPTSYWIVMFTTFLVLSKSLKSISYLHYVS